ncbi:MAG: hypothetical protein WAT78_09650, partial [Rhizobiaceae bacterium]
MLRPNPNQFVTRLLAAVLMCSIWGGSQAFALSEIKKEPAATGTEVLPDAPKATGEDSGDDEEVKPKAPAKPADPAKPEAPK